MVLFYTHSGCKSPVNIYRQVFIAAYWQINLTHVYSATIKRLLSSLAPSTSANAFSVLFAPVGTFVRPFLPTI